MTRNGGEAETWSTEAVEKQLLRRRKIQIHLPLNLKRVKDFSLPPSINRRRYKLHYQFWFHVRVGGESRTGLSRLNKTKHVPVKIQTNLQPAQRFLLCFTRPLETSFVYSKSMTRTVEEAESRIILDDGGVRGWGKRKIHLGLEKETRATVEQVLDGRTLAILEKLKKRGLLAEFNGTISTGKEANVYHCKADYGGELAVKIFRTSILSFKDRARYVEGEYRFRYGYSGSGNPRKMVKQWAEKEFRNLHRIFRTAIPCPKPIELRGHVIAMEFLGTDGVAAPRLKDATLARGEWFDIYIQVLAIMRLLYIDCRLVHGDLSEYNLLLDDGNGNEEQSVILSSCRRRVLVIDVSQAVEHDHEHSLDFLKRDCLNITKFFEKQELLFRPSEDTCPDGSRDDGNQHEVLDHACDSDVGSPLGVRELFTFVVSPDIIPHCGGVSGTDTGCETADTGGICDEEGQLERRRRFDDYCVEVRKYVESRSCVGDVGGEVEEQVFLNTWIPSNLHQISDFHLIEEEMKKLSKEGTPMKTGSQQQLPKILYEQLLGSAGSAATETHADCGDDEYDDDDDDDDGRVEIPAARASAGQAAESSDCDSTDEEEEEAKPSYVDGKFTGEIPVGMDRKVWKKLVKEENREKRQDKVPKHVKKRRRAKAKKG